MSRTDAADIALLAWKAQSRHLIDGWSILTDRIVFTCGSQSCRLPFQDAPEFLQTLIRTFESEQSAG